MADLVVRLLGGLGNQMFQYATGRAVAQRHGMRLLLDTRTGFLRDHAFRRTFALECFCLQARTASRLHELAFGFERAVRPVLSSPSRENRRPWGVYVREIATRYEPIEFERLPKTVLMEGYWQSERYFSDMRERLATELAVPLPTDERVLSMANEMERTTSVAVGVRVFEEVPGEGKEGVGGLVPYSFYERAAQALCEKVENPSFYVFCTTRHAVENRIRLPGSVRYVTADEGFSNELDALWLLSRCRHHILSNSTFYWWGAWLAEQAGRARTIIAADLFPNCDAIPERWTTLRAHNGDAAPNCSLRHSPV